MERDGQSNIKVISPEIIAITAISAPYEVAGTAIDTLGARKVTFAVEPNEAISTDVAHLKLYECATSGGIYTAVDAAKYVYTGASTQIVDADSRSMRTIGVVDTLRYVKPYINAVTIADDITFDVSAVLEMGVTNGAGIDAKP